MATQKKKKIRSKKKQAPPFSLYTDDENPSFDEGWSSVINLLRGRKNIVVITGAGISVSSGIPDFRSKGSGLYSTLDIEALGLSCPEDLFDVHFFRDNPAPFYYFARKLYFPLQGEHDDTNAPPPRARPSDSHKLLSLLEQKKMLLRVYSQNIDGLEEEAGVSPKKICYAHGSLQWSTCCKCKRKVSSKEIERDILNGTVARCQAPIGLTPAASATAQSNSVKVISRKRSSRKRSRLCEDICEKALLDENGQQLCGGVMKPGITFFGEVLGNNVKAKLESDRHKVDALIVIGTSLSVAPISKVVGYLPANIPRVLINRTIVHPPACPDDDNSDDDDSSDDDEKEFRENYVFDAYLLGYCDDVTRALGKEIFKVGDHSSSGGNDDVALDGHILTSILEGNDDDSSYDVEDWEDVAVPSNRVFLFPGAQAPTGTAEEIKYEEIAHCDGCSRRIDGTIHKCVICFDYDLCQKCFPKLSKTHYDGKHDFTSEQAT